MVMGDSGEDAREITVVIERPIRESGNSLVVSIPPILLHTAGLGEDDTVLVSAQGDGKIELEQKDKETEAE